MNQKSLKDIKKELIEIGYSFSDFTITSIGNYHPDDADWNYKDTLHIETMHDSIEFRTPVLEQENLQLAIDTQKVIPFLGLKFPLTLVILESSKYNFIYYTAFGPFLMLTNTVIERHEDDKTKTTSYFSIGSIGFFKIFHPLVKKTIIKNNKILMKDDEPMRIRKGLLRKENHLFYKDEKGYGFLESKNIKYSNVYLKPTIDNFISIKKSDIINTNENQMIGNENGLLSFFITNEENGSKKLWPSTCTHEGAKLTKKCMKNKSLTCPWHGRKRNYILKIDAENKMELKENLDFSCKVDEENIIIKFRNEPEYYRKGSLKYFNHAD